MDDHRYHPPTAARIEANAFDGELIILNMDTRYYYSASGSAPVIWELAERRLTRGAIATALAERYGLDRDAVADAVRTFLDTLVVEDLIGAPVAGDAAATIADVPAGAPAAWAEPAMTRFDDLVEAFALDPPLVIGER